MTMFCNNCDDKLGDDRLDDMFCSEECYYEYVGAETPDEQEAVAGGGTEHDIASAIQRVREARK